MMDILKQSTAATIKFGPFIDDGDGKTAETSLTISQADIRLSKNGGDIAQSHNSAGATHDELGYYDIPLDTTDTGTLGRLRVIVSESGALPVWQDFMVLKANVYDSLVAGSDYLDVNTVELADDIIAAGKFDESTAFPLKSADTGSTQVARTGADGDTLESLSDEIAVVDGNVDDILTDTGTTLDTLVKDIPTVAEFEARTIVAADYFDPAADAVATVTTLTNLPTMPADWVTASGLKADAVTKIQNGLATAAALANLDGDVADVFDDVGDVKTVIGDIQTTLASPDNFKADVSALATSAEVGALAFLQEIVVGDYTAQDILTILAAKFAGLATGGGTTTITYRGLDNSSDVIVETVDANGNRSEVVLTV